MGFLSGAVTVQRFTAGKPAGGFGEAHLRRLRNNAAGMQKIATADGVETGWTAGDSILDRDFTLEKNVYPVAMVFEFQTTTNTPSPALLKAYYAEELKVAAAANPSGLPSARQKREAKEAARDRVEEEAKDGRFRKRRCEPCMWDRGRGEFYFGSTSVASAMRVTDLFNRSFAADLTDTDHPAALSCEFVPITAASLAIDHHTDAEQATPTDFTGTNPNAECVWSVDQARPDYLGSEFLLWLWFTLDVDSDTVALTDQSEATVMMARTLTLECPRGQTGRETIAYEGPTRLPEALRAIQSGKMPRKAGITMVRYDQQFEFQLDAETLAIRGGKLPPPSEDSGRARIENRLQMVGELVDGVELLYFAFLDVRFGKAWPAELERMRRWIGGERKAVA